jgi:zona occludens toxin
MITLFTGMPGAGKTAALVDLLSKLDKDRPLFVDGLNGLTLDHSPVDAHKWPDELPDGAILVIDEVQRVWRPRGPGAKVPEEVAALETHRHRGIDVYLTTQAPRLLDANVRGLVGRHVHIRDTGWLGRHWYEWPEVNEAMTWKTCPNKRKFKLPKKAFELYKSASMHTKPVRGTPVALYVAALALVGVAAGAFLVYRIVSKGMNGGTDTKPAVEAKTTASGSSTAPAHHGAGPRAIDDRVDWIPRVSYRPESAPAFDHLREVKAMPVVSAAICIDDDCKCLTQQSTNAGLTAQECREWAANRPFNPYRVERVETASADTPSGASRAAQRESAAGGGTLSAVSPFSLAGAAVTGAR